MKLANVGAPGKERPIVMTDSGTMFDALSVTDRFSPDFLAENGISRIAEKLNRGHLPAVDTRGERIGPPIIRPGKIVCVGLNYHQHAQETGATAPSEPILFLKAPSAIVGPNDPVIIPPGSLKTDWEVELAVVIESTARYLAGPDQSLAHIAGYTISNDVSERSYQLERGGQWDKGKSCESFNPLGPWLVTTDEIPDPQTLDLRLWVNGELRQNGTTSDMIFDVSYLVWYVSQFMVLEPGDIINTGTPAGVALGRPGLPYLADGDEVRIEVTGLGTQQQTFRSA
jgi:2-keto-4-pentenoate hydratase/2-oxohepta-3-ene-1,7-dioic acid hydratase in catechol pathway